MITRRTGGSIILTASMAGHIVNYPQTHVAYGTSKAGVQHMTHCLAAEWAEYGVRVNSLSPGYMDTRLNVSDDLTDVLPTWFERTPMGRMGLKEELIGPVVLLASSAGGFMTGSDLRVDGKRSLWHPKFLKPDAPIFRWRHALLRRTTSSRKRHLITEKVDFGLRTLDTNSRLLHTEIAWSRKHVQ